MQRVTKKDRQRLKAEEAAAREQFAKWVSTKAPVSLIFAGSFFAAGMEGHLEQESNAPDALEFFGSQTSFNMSIALDRCAFTVARHGNRVAVWIGGPTEPALVLSDPDSRKLDVDELLKRSGGRPN